MIKPHRTSVVLAGAAVLAAGLGGLVLTIGTPTSAQAARVTATCGNVSSDASRIQTAINGSAPGDEIVIDGPCLITATISLAGNRAYRGDSRSTVLTAGAGSNLAAVLASDSWTNNSPTTGEPITLRDLTVDANADGNPTGGDGIVIRSWQTTVEAVTVQDAPKNGLRITSASRNGTVLTNTQVNGTVRNVFVTNSGQNGIYVQDSANALTDWNLQDNWVADSDLNGIRLENAAGWTVERNHVYGNGASGISADRLFGSSLSDNYVEDFGSSGNGIGVTVQGDAASTIMGNRVFQFSAGGSTYLAIKQVNYGTGLVSVTGNTIRGSGTGTGLSYQRGSNQLTVTSTGNAVTGVTTPRSVGAGVTVTAGL